MQDRNELKIQALLQKISKITTSYENQEADYRVELTILEDKFNETFRELEELKASTNSDVEYSEDVPEEE